MSTGSVRIERPAAGVAHVVLDNPSSRNALTHGMFRRLAELWQELEADRTVRVVMLSGEGDAAFCSGADLSAGLTETSGIDDLVERALLKTTLFAKPIVAAINGHCVAGGLELALAADIRIAWEDARIGLPEVRWGILPSGGAAMKLIDQIGHANAMDLLLSGRLIDGRKAERIGLVNEAVPRSEVRRVAMERAMEIAANSPAAVAATKTAALAHRCAGYAKREAAERALVARVRASGHWRVGIDAFLARHVPLYDD
ncbi:enoyl-CoA hydratase/isomerase family protein [Xanthobacter autotrophicus]|uniref:enoyl-CoA hydratase/isomerase family protein n=1 Tax=Xanthobacter autotrophicus TaxID=280 RepID=UPI00372AC2F2